MDVNRKYTCHLLTKKVFIRSYSRKSCDIVFDFDPTETNLDDEDDASGALEAAANEFFEQFNIVKTDFKNPCQGQLPFSEFKKDLKEVSSGVNKKVLKEGQGDVIDVEQSVVTYQFAMFLEGSDKPFDSSFINNRPAVIKAGVGILPGIFRALSTMKQGEAADFWIRSDLMFGLKGFCTILHKSEFDKVSHFRMRSESSSICRHRASLKNQRRQAAAARSRSFQGRRRFGTEDSVHEDAEESHEGLREGS